MKYNNPRMMAVCLALAALLVSCPSPLGTATSGTIRLSFSGAPRATIETPEVIDPTIAIKTLLVEVTGPGMEKLTSQPVAYDTAGTTLTMSIPAGLNRAVTISARNETGTTLYSQVQTVTIVAGKELQVAFNLDGVLYSITFDANSGTGTMDPQSIAYGSSVALTENGFTKAGYSFVGWATSATANANYADKAEYTMGTPSATLYAVWSVITISGQFTGWVLEPGQKNNGGILTVNGVANSEASFAASSGSSTYGSYSLTTQGQWAYTLTTPEDSTVNDLAVGAWTTDTFNIYAGGSTQTITITIWGADETDYAAGQYIQGDGSGGGGGGATGDSKGGAGGSGGGSNDSLPGTDGNDIIFADGSGGGGGGRGVGFTTTNEGDPGTGGGGSDIVVAGLGNDIIFGDGFNGKSQSQWGGWGGFGGGGGGGGGANLGDGHGGQAGLGAGAGSGYIESGTILVAGFGYVGGSGTAPGGNSVATSESITGSGGLSPYGFGGGGGFGGASGGAGATNVGSSGFGGNAGDANIHSFNDSTGSIHSYVLGRLATILTDYPAYGAGIDTLDGGAGSDHLFGLGGADTFVFELDDAFNGNDIDTIWDFNKNAEADQLKLLITGVVISPTVRDDLIITQVTENVTDRKLVFSDGMSKQVTIVIKNLSRDIVASDFTP